MRSMSFRVAVLAVAVAACDRTAKVDPEPQRPTSTADAATVPTTSASGTYTEPTDTPPPAKGAVVPMPPTKEVEPLAAANNGFAFALWPRLGQPGKNLAFSPASMSIAFAMVAPGAKGETATQISKVLRFGGDADAIANGWGKLSRALTSEGRPVKIRIANRLFGEKTATFLPRYLERTKTVFDAPLEPLDFKGAAEPSRMRINAWVEEKTEKRIKDLLPPKALDDLTRLVLVNAIYFLADWEAPFSKEATRDEDFTLAGGTKKKVPTMHEATSARFAKVDGAKVLDLPYMGHDVVMRFVVPEKTDGLAALEKTLSAEKLAAFGKALATTQVEMAIPRFEIASDAIPLAEQLTAMGMPVAFDRDKADFGGIAMPVDPRERLHISNVFHKAFVKVDEKGTEAAAATAIAMAAGGGMPPKAEPFVADHPFLFFILERTSGLVLFAGRVADPTAK
jgi:serpin B